MNGFKKLSVVMLKESYRLYMKSIDDRFDEDKFFIYLGEIPNMLGHCVVIGMKSERIFMGYHIDDFRLPTEDEF